MIQSKPLILAVDDERGVTTLLQRALGLAGYEVITADNGSQALGLVEQRKPDLILLDIKMPGKSGIEVLQELRSGYPDIAVIIATAVADVDVAIKALTEGAYGYLNKPFNINELILVVERAIERRRLLLQNRDYQLNLENKVKEQSQALEQRVRELTALNTLFTKYLNQSFDAADKYVCLADGIVKASEEIRTIENVESRISLADGIAKKAGEISALAKEAQAIRRDATRPEVGGGR